MEDIGHLKSSIGALYVEDLFEFFMNKYMIAWQRPYGISKSLHGVPVLFTQEIGRTAFNISRFYHYRRKVEESELREYFTCKSVFYRLVYSKLLECLCRPEEASFFHVSAYAGEVAVFCKLENVSYLHQVLISAILELLKDYCSLHLETTRLYYRNLATEIDEGRINGFFSEMNPTLTNQSFQNENLISNPEADSGDDNNNQYANPSVVMNPIQSVDANYNTSQHQTFIHLDTVPSFSGASFSHPSRYTSFPATETMASGYAHQNLIDAQSIPASSSAYQPECPYNQQVPEYFSSPIVPSVVYHSTVESASHVQPDFVSSSPESPEFTVASPDILSFNTVTDTNLTEHSPTENNNGNVSAMECPQSNSTSQALNVNAPVFVHSSELSRVDSSNTEVIALE